MSQETQGAARPECGCATAGAIAPGLCQCGCGGRTWIAKSSSARYGWVKGQPTRFIRGHCARLVTQRKMLEYPERGYEFEITDKLKKKFMDAIFPDPNSGCFIYAGPENESGYGLLKVGSKANRTHRYIRAHHFAWTLSGREIPLGQIIRHKCDTPSCCNPDHLECGTKRQNTADMLFRKRTRPAESGLPFGVVPRNGRFRVVCGPRNTNRYHGTYDTIEEAAAVADAMRIKLFSERR